MDLSSIFRAKISQPSLRLVCLSTEDVIHIPVEEYLLGVVPSEVYSYWPWEAICAQAVAARSFTFYAIKHPRHFELRADLCIPGDFVHCQAYDPRKRTNATDKAVRATEGLVVFYGKNPANCLFHANCGGQTLNNEDVFETTNQVPYLRGVECPEKGKIYGHRCGMCQRGAAELARQGYTWQQILAHFYRETTIEKLW